jgi:hypothetical protein
MTVKCLHARKKFFVVAERDEHLCMVAYCLLEDRKWALTDFVFLKRTKLRLVELGLGNVNVLTVIDYS